MKRSMKLMFAVSASLITLTACAGEESKGKTIATAAKVAAATTASISQGPAKVTTANLFKQGGRVAGLGLSTASDGTTWVVPAEVDFTNDAVPFAPDLHNTHGNKYDNAESAIAALDGSDIVTVDAGGEVITAYVFADNYFDMYVNGVAVGKDPVPFTQFNSNIVRFKATKPFTVAMHLVDWEENLGLGSENNRGKSYHAGDGGMVAVFKDASGATIGTTGPEWKAQTFYTAPLKTTDCLVEKGSLRDSSACNMDGSDDGTSFYGYHWTLDKDWMKADFDDSSWQAATTFTNDEIGVKNKDAYMNFTSIFDDKANDAEFIWSSNVVLDNSVIVRHTFK